MKHRILLTCLLALPLLAAAADAQDFSAAEKLLFMSPHLHSVKPPTTLKYSFRRSGSLEAGFEDGISLVLSAKAGGGCCAAHTEFFSGARSLPLPDVAEAEGNPVLLAYLEREVREMQRLTKGSQNHFRKLMRLAVYEGATLGQLTLNFRGKPVAVQEVLIKPFLNDANRPRYENLAVKEYRFLMCDAVPGGLYGIRTRVAGTEGAAPLQIEEMYLAGAEPVATE